MLTTTLLHIWHIQHPSRLSVPGHTDGYLVLRMSTEHWRGGGQVTDGCGSENRASERTGSKDNARYTIRSVHSQHTMKPISHITCHQSSDRCFVNRCRPMDQERRTFWTDKPFPSTLLHREQISRITQSGIDINRYYLKYVINIHEISNERSTHSNLSSMMTVAAEAEPTVGSDRGSVGQKPLSIPGI
ncbi:hypothetical protein J6590_018655 [Homalodisca vitripennis]|nr:hypothetical protein J6590_018655 [Homalodisca vitripennis]